MWIVRLALRRPYTVATLCLAIALFGVLCIKQIRVDVLPAIDIPVVVVVWSYPGLTAEEMEKRVTFLTERALSTSVNDIERVESESIDGIGLVRIYFHLGTNLGPSIAEVSAVCNSVLRGMPPGITPPTILQLNASNVPVAQLTIAGKTVGEQDLFDYGLNTLRLRLFTVPGLATPAPFGGRQKQVMVDIDPAKMSSEGLSPQDIVAAITSQNVILPAGTARIGQHEYDVLMNNSPAKVTEFDSLPLKAVGNRVVRLGEVAHVHEGYAVQTNVVHVNGQRSTYLALLRKEGSSTLAVVDTVKQMLPQLKAAAPQGMELKIDFDQSIFVRAAVKEVLREGLLAAVLVSLMILFFLGSWRSTVIVCSSIPIAILVSVIGLFLTGQTLNLMTLGGLALAIGMLVDDATVEVENIHRNREAESKGDEPAHLTRVVLDSAHQIAVPALAATLTICIVFFPVVLLTGPAKFLFTPLALSVVFAMLASYLLSRTLVPAMAKKLLPKEDHKHPNRFNRWRDRQFNRLQRSYDSALGGALERRAVVLIAVLLLLVSAGALWKTVGLDFFPSVDTGQMRLHYRAQAGTRIEETEQQVLAVEQELKKIIEQKDLDGIVDTIGVPLSYNIAFVPTDNVGGEDAEIRVQLKKGHKPTEKYIDEIREKLPGLFPGARFWFAPADVVSQVLSFGAAAPLDVQVSGRNSNATLKAAQEIAAQVQRIPGVVDTRIAQVVDRPSLRVDVDRDQAQLIGLSERDVASSLLTSLSSSSLQAPSFWVNPQTGINYSVAVQTPINLLQRVDQLLTTPITPNGGNNGQPGRPALSPYLGSIATLHSLTSKAVINHDTVQPIVEVQMAASGRDLGAVANDVKAAVDSVKLPDGASVKIRGQSDSMFQAFTRLGLGFILAVALVYLLLVILFQSWLDPLLILVAVPGAMIGILWMLAITGTTLNVESLMGAIMAVGIATSNSILLVSFANDHRAGEKEDPGPFAAMRAAGKTRLRPVLMTALAMILGMLPMALSLGEGGEQNAPLGRAVIGGLLAATFVTLFVVPVAYTLLRKKMPAKHLLDVEFAKEIGEPAPESGPGLRPAKA